MLLQRLILCALVGQGLSSPRFTEDRFRNGFECDDGLVIPREWMCNGYEDCLSAEDEKDCPVEVTTTSTPTPVQDISSTDIHQPTEKRIIPIFPFTAYENGNCVLDLTKINGFICDVHKCVPNFFKCDGVINCEDGSDEHHCTVETTTNNVTTTESSLEEVTTTEKAVETSKPVQPPHLLMPRCQLSDGSGEGFSCDVDRCIRPFYLCDGDLECNDGADERHCGTDIKNSEEEEPSKPRRCVLEHTFLNTKEGFKCDSAHGPCIPAAWQCDGDPDCQDGSDEQNCRVETTKKTVTLSDRSLEEVTPGSETNNPGEESSVAKEIEPSDSEHLCTLPRDQFTFLLTREGFKCSNGGRCIPAAWRCDGDPDCYDESDELNCQVQTKTSTVETTDRPSGGVTPGSETNQPGKDLSADKETSPPPDNDRRCTLPPIFLTLVGTDEGHRCGVGRCISVSLLCDGEQDCTDGSDEVNCPVETVTDTTTTSTSSAEEETTSDSDERCTLPRDQFTFLLTRDGFKCGESGRCIPAAWQCDGDPDCYDESDELNCQQTKTSTVETTDRPSGGVTSGSETNQPEKDLSADKETTPPPDIDRRCTLPTIFLTLVGTDEGHRCGVGRCISVTLLCDGVEQCTDGSDEVNCPVETVTDTTTTSTSSPEEETTPDSDVSGIAETLVESTNELIMNVNDLPPLPITVNMRVENMNNYFQLNNNRNQEIPRTGVKEKKKRFELETTKASWVEAHVICKSKGGELASITSEDENALALLSLTSSDDRVSQAWIGGVCPDKEKACYWTDSWKQFDYTSWFAGEPNHLYYNQRDEMCVQLKLKDNSWRWNDNLCLTELPFICQYFH